jgi:hypothetical protein
MFFYCNLSNLHKKATARNEHWIIFPRLNSGTRNEKKKIWRQISLLFVTAVALHSEGSMHSMVVEQWKASERLALAQVSHIHRPTLAFIDVLPYCAVFNMNMKNAGLSRYRCGPTTSTYRWFINRSQDSDNSIQRALIFRYKVWRNFPWSRNTVLLRENISWVFI